MLIFLFIISYFSRHNENETPENEDMDQLEAKDGNSSGNMSEFPHPLPAKKTEDQHLEKVFDLLKARFIQAISVAILEIRQLPN
jgi:hypothetical protein